MSRLSGLFLQIVIGCLAIGVLAFLLWEPHLEGRNTHATLFEVYFKDPFLAYVYLGSTPFFLALYRAFRLLAHVRKKGSFSQVTMDELGTIRRCAITLMGFIAGGVVYILIFGDQDDRPAGVFMGFLLALVSAGIATTAAMLARRLAKHPETLRGTKES